METTQQAPSPLSGMEIWSGTQDSRWDAYDEMSTAHQVLADLSHEMGLATIRPVLRGTPKQIEWATRIRTRIFAELDQAEGEMLRRIEAAGGEAALAALGPKAIAVHAAAVQALTEIRGEASAAKWINNRESSGQAWFATQTLKCFLGRSRVELANDKKKGERK